MAADKRYREAIARRDRLRAELAQVEQFIALYDSLFREEVSEQGRGPLTPQAPASTPERNNVWVIIQDQSEFERIARKVLLARGRPATRGEFAKLLEQHGYKVSGDNPMKNVGTKLWRARNTITHLNEGYWPIDVACIDVNYKPPQSGGGSSGHSSPSKVETKGKGGGEPRQLLS